MGLDVQSAAESSSSDMTAEASAATNMSARRYTYAPRPYPADECGFSPVDKALAKAHSRGERNEDDDEGALNPCVIKFIFIS